MFDAIVKTPFTRSDSITKGRTYRVIDANAFYGTYTILNDLGEITNLNWLHFEDMGKALDAYIATLEI